MKVNYRMAAPPGVPPPKSRGHSLFDRQAQLHANDPNKPFIQPPSVVFDIPVPLPQLKAVHSLSSPPIPASPIVQQHYSSPSIIHRRLPHLSSDSHYLHSNDTNVQLLSVNPRPESTYIVDLPPQPPALSKPLVVQQLLETDFPLVENSSTQEPPSTSSLPSDTACCALVEQAFDYLPRHDEEYDNDDDDDVVVVQRRKPTNDDEQRYDTDDFDEESDDADSVDTIDLDVATGIHHQNDSGVHTLSSTVNSDKRLDHNHREEKFHDHPPMSASRGGTGSEDYDSDSENRSHEDEIEGDDDTSPTGTNNSTTNPEQFVHDDSTNDQEEEQQKQLILRQQKILWGIVQEWLRKEELFIDQLKMMDQQLNHMSVANTLQHLIEQLISQHKSIHREIEFLYERDHQPFDLTKQLTRTIDILMQTLPQYDEYIKTNVAPVRKALEKRTNSNGISSEDLLSIPPKQLLQILSQVQDLYQTAQSLESADTDSIKKLYEYAQKCKLFASRQDENINKIILKNEDIVILAARGTRDRCRLILYPDAIVCCYLKPKLLTSPKYILAWYIPMFDLHWAIPQSSSEENSGTGNELKSGLKSAYKELEKTPKSSNTTASRISKNIRKQENEYNLAQSKLQLILSNTDIQTAPAVSSISSRSTISSIILFSSAYHRQDWIDLIDKTKQELFQRSSTTLNSNHQHLRLTDSLVQKRLELVKPNLHENLGNDLPSTSRTSPQHNQLSTPASTKPYSGTLNITIYSLHGSSLYNPIRQHQTLPPISSTSQQMPKSYQFYVAVEIDSYNTFYPYAQTARQSMQQQESVEFKGESFQVELEYSHAFRLLIYRIDTSSAGNNSSLQRAQCIGKFHRNIETALYDCGHSQNGILPLESPSGDLKLKISLKYIKREGTFSRRRSKRSQAIFGKSIERLMSTPDGNIDHIPRIIVKCVQMVQRDGLNETGIYRVCCVASELQKLRHTFDQNYHRGEEMLAEKNVHVAANLLKLFFRELPEPLFTTTLYKEFLHAIQLTDMDNQRVSLSATIGQLHPDNRRILFYLFDHLIRVSEHSQTNMMHLDNLAVVFGPTLMRPSKLIATSYYAGSNQRLNATGAAGGNQPPTQTDLDQMSSELQGSMYQCQVVLACLKLRRDGVLQ